MGARFDSQKAQFKIDTSKLNYDDWNIYESFLIGNGRKLPTLLKQLGAFKRLLRLYPSDNINNKQDIIDAMNK